MNKMFFAQNWVLFFVRPIELIERTSNMANLFKKRTNYFYFNDTGDIPSYV